MDWMTIIQNYGFPVLACCVMAWYVYDSTEKARNDRKETERLHKEETDRLSEVINNNTLAITRLVERMEKE